MEVQKYQLDGVKGAVCTPHRRSQFHPLQTMNIKGNAGVKGHCMKVHVLTEPASWSPVAGSSGAHSYLWRATPWLFKGAQSAYTT